jgi:large subunit ribosomal protein L21
MYAIVETGGKQYRAAVGEVLEVELLGVGEGEAVEFDRVLLVTGDEGTRVGTPYLSGTIVRGEVTKAEVKDRKIVIFKMKRRKGYRKKTGHRQRHTHVRVTAIEG